MSILCNISYVFEKVCSQTSFYMFANQIVCVECFAHYKNMLHVAVITLQVISLSVRLTSMFDWWVIDYNHRADTLIG